MMKAFKKSLMAVAAVAALSGAGSANAYLENWYLDTNGAAAGGGITVLESLTISGSALVTNTFSSATNFTFDEAGSFVADKISITNQSLPNNLTAQFTGSGYGVTSLTGGSLSFTSGALELFDISANSIGKFVLVDGSANLGAANSVLPNGDVSLIFRAVSLDSGYFFKDASKTLDLADVVTAPGGLLFGFATTNAKPITSNLGALAAYNTNKDLYNSTFGPDFVFGAPNTLILENGGQFAFQVPEPGSLALIGLGLLGAGVARRRKVVAN